MIDFFSFHANEPMLFTSGLFWVLFIFFLLIYSQLYNRKWQMVTFVTAFSLFFYYKSSGLFVFMLAATSFIDWMVSKQIDRSQVPLHRKLWLALSLTISLGLLAYFKYANFLSLNFSLLVSRNFQLMDIILPVGISFYTFQSVSYIVDVYKRKVPPTNTWLEYCFFLSFFPQLVAGPIVRADHFLPQIGQYKRISKEVVYAGLWLVIIGIFKKGVVADYISQYNDLIFDAPMAYSGFENAMAILGYTAQIYCDFSGYSDMAIGIGVLMGFDLGVNFRTPYQSLNITEFWRRWHISLSTWLRDYIYIPLGGSRKGRLRTYMNNLLTMLIGGLWHGASWKFVFWGGMHGMGLLTHKAMKPYLDKLPNSPWINAASWLVTFLFVSLMWVFFRAADFKSAFALISHTVNDFSLDYARPFFLERTLWCVLIVTIFALHSMRSSSMELLSDWFISSSWMVKLIVFLVVIQLVIQLKSASVSPFIYFQF